MTQARRSARLRLPSVALVAVGIVAASLAGAGDASASAPPTPSGWTQQFGDDFNGAANTGLNTANWLYDIGTGYPGGAANWGTGEVETMTNSTANVYQDGGGNLVIKPIRDASGHWTTGRVETQRTDFAAPAGGKLRIEAPLQQPNVSGAAAAGYWPAFWALGAAARGTRRDRTGRASARSTSWRTSTGCSSVFAHPALRHLARRTVQRDHRHRQRPARLRRLPDRLPHVRDGVGPQRLARADAVLPRRQQLLHASTRNQVDATTWNNATHHGFFMILNVAIGGGFPAAFGGGPTGATQSGVPMLVDYVAAYTSGGDRPAAVAAEAAARRVPARSPTPTVCASTTTPPAPPTATRSRSGAATARVAQRWTFVQAGSTLHVQGKCLDISGGGTANGTKVQLWDCNNTGAQVWIPQSNGSYWNPQSNRCLDDPNGSTTAGTQVQIWDCNGTGAQNWTLHS